MKEEAQLTFKPSVNQYNDVRAQLNLRHPEAYLAQVGAKRQAQLAQRLEERRSREVIFPPMCTVLLELPLHTCGLACLKACLSRRADQQSRADIECCILWCCLLRTSSATACLGLQIAAGAAQQFKLDAKHHTEMRFYDECSLCSLCTAHSKSEPLHECMLF